MHVQYLGRLAELLHQYTPLPRSNILTDDVWPVMAVQLSSLSNKQTLSKQGKLPALPSATCHFE